MRILQILTSIVDLVTTIISIVLVESILVIVHIVEYVALGQNIPDKKCATSEK